MVGELRNFFYETFQISYVFDTPYVLKKLALILFRKLNLDQLYLILYNYDALMSKLEMLQNMAFC